MSMPNRRGALGAAKHLRGSLQTSVALSWRVFDDQRNRGAGNCPRVDSRI
jgi:hypothetical protein